MENFLNNKQVRSSFLLVMFSLSLLMLMKFINEVKSSHYVGHENIPPYTISVTGKGEVMAVSDIASIDMTISKDGATAKEAQNLLNESLTKVLAYLKSKNIADKDIKSEYGGLNPKYVYSNVVCIRYPCPQSDPKIVGYTATQSITVKVRVVDTANDIKTGLATVGVTNISGPTFSIDNQDNLNDQARAKAIIDAQEKAKVLARELGVHIGKVTSFSESSDRFYPMMYDKAMNAVGGAESSTPAPELPKGENKITSNVSITYEIN